MGVEIAGGNVEASSGGTMMLTLGTSVVLSLDSDTPKISPAYR